MAGVHSGSAAEALPHRVARYQVHLSPRSLDHVGRPSQADALAQGIGDYAVSVGRGRPTYESSFEVLAGLLDCGNTQKRIACRFSDVGVRIAERLPESWNCFLRHGTKLVQQ